VALGAGIASARCDAIAVVGDPGRTLRNPSEIVDLIVVGLRRWGTVARLLLGSVSETLVADAGCSVLIVPRPGRVTRRHHATGSVAPAPSNTRTRAQETQR
jgi:nucleotide-binding universal stress UspA family protein